MELVALACRWAPLACRPRRSERCRPGPRAERHCGATGADELMGTAGKRVRAENEVRLEVHVAVLDSDVVPSPISSSYGSRDLHRHRPEDDHDNQLEV